MNERGTWLGASVAFLLLMLLVLSTVPERIQADIDRRAGEVLARDVRDGGWGTVIVSGRDLSLYGTAPDDVVALQSVRELRGLWGVRNVRDHSEVAALRSIEATTPVAAAPQVPAPARHYTAREWAALSRPLDAYTCQRLVDALLSRRGIGFAPGTATIDAHSQPLLEHLSTAAAHCPQTNVTVAGHTADSGRSSVDRRLSAERARSVGEILAERGVSRQRLRILGHGAEQPVADSATAGGRAMNERIEITLTPPSRQN